MASAHGARRGLLLLGALVYLLAAALLLAAARGDLWFDEVVSMSYARIARGPWDVVQRFRVDNNHVLNTLYLWALGPDQPWVPVYRGLAVASALALLALLAWCARRHGPGAALLALLLAGSSFPLVLYGSEARGYAPAMCAGVAAWAALSSAWRRLGAANVLAFWTALVLGFVAHLTFVMVAGALAAAALVQALGDARPWPRRLVRLAVLFGPPLAVVAAFLLDFARGMSVIGGPVRPPGVVLGTAAAMLLGLPDSPVGRGVALAGYAALAAGAPLLALRREPLHERAFFVAVLLLAPLGMLALARPEYLYFRYFAVAFPFFYLLLAIAVAAACRGRWRRAAPLVAVLLALWGVGQGARLGPLLVLGRGSTSDMLRYAAEHSDVPELRIGCDSETTLLVDFAAPRALPGRAVHCVGNATWPADPPEWLVIRSLQRFFEAPPQMEFVPGHQYRLARAFRFGGGSGWSTFLYRRADAGGAA